MKITVVGSTGRTGRQVVEGARRRGHDVTAFTRRPDALGTAGISISSLAAVVAGDGRDPEPVRAAVAGADAVIAIIAAGRSGPHQAAEVLRTILAAMNEADVRRLVVTSAYPMVDDRPRLPVALLRLVLAAAYADAAVMEKLVAASDRDWTIVRLNRLLDRPARGSARVSRDLLDRPSPITRADAAVVLLNLTESDAHPRVAVNVAGR